VLPGDNSKIAPAIIESIAIDVVNDETFGEIHNNVLHRNVFTVHISTRIKGIGTFAIDRTPFRAIERLEVAFIDDGVLASCQLDSPVRDLFHS
jgi:hypothetical protein